MAQHFAKEYASVGFTVVGEKGSGTSVSFRFQLHERSAYQFVLFVAVELHGSRVRDVRIHRSRKAFVS